MQSKARTVAAYLASLPADRRAAIEAIRTVILKNLDKGYEEGMLYGGICYSVKRSVFPAGYHCDPSKPLCFAGLASQRNHLGVYLMCLYGSKEEERSFRDAWARSGAKKLDMGKCCIRFKKIEDAALDVIGDAIRRMPAKTYVAHYIRSLESAKSARTRAHLVKAKATTPGGRGAAAPKKKAAAKKAAGKKTAKASRARRIGAR